MSKFLIILFTLLATIILLFIYCSFVVASRSDNQKAPNHQSHKIKH